MGKHDFDEMTIRRGTNCVKWDADSPAGPIDEDVIPLWVADMDFKARDHGGATEEGRTRDIRLHAYS